MHFPRIPSIERRQIDHRLHLHVFLLELTIILVFVHAVVHFVTLLKAGFDIGTRSSCLVGVTLELDISFGHVAYE